MQLNEASQLLCSVRCVLRRQWTSQYRGDAAGFTRGRERDGSCRIPKQYCLRLAAMIAVLAMHLSVPGRALCEKV